MTSSSSSIVAVPSYAERNVTTAYYQAGSREAARPGYFYANTYDLKSRPKWEMEALSLHESVPGHHLHIALATELEARLDNRKPTTKSTISVISAKPAR